MANILSEKTKDKVDDCKNKKEIHDSTAIEPMAKSEGSKCSEASAKTDEDSKKRKALAKLEEDSKNREVMAKWEAHHKNKATMVKSEELNKNREVVAKDRTKKEIDQEETDEYLQDDISDVKNDKKTTIWIYAVVICTSAFVVLLLTAYSQIKFNGNIVEYRKKITTGEEEKGKFKLDLDTAMKENNKLYLENTAIKDELKKSKEVNALLKKDSEQKEKFALAFASFEALSSAEIEFQKGNLESCAMILKNNVDANVIGAVGLQRYTDLKEITFIKVSLSLFNEGFAEYTSGNYALAKEKLLNSYKISNMEYYSDDCLYYYAVCELKLGNQKVTKEYFEKLLREYPETTFSKDIKYLMELNGIK